MFDALKAGLGEFNDVLGKDLTESVTKAATLAQQKLAEAERVIEGGDEVVIVDIP
jgi:hypothetical protein